MTPKQIREVADEYFQQLEEFGFSAEKQSDGPLGSLHSFPHVMWMCQELKGGMAKKDMEKACRWLGFIQGVLWSRGTYSIDDMREHNR